MIHTQIRIQGMSCGHCVKAVEKALSNLEVEIKNIGIGSVEVEYDESKIDKEDIINAIESAGYKTE